MLYKDLLQYNIYDKLLRHTTVPQHIILFKYIILHYIIQFGYIILRI